MTGDPTLDGIFAGIVSFCAIALTFEIGIGWLAGSFGGRSGGGADYEG